MSDTAIIDWTKQVAKALGEGWTGAERGAGAELKRASDGLTFFARTEYPQPNRAVLSLSTDHDHLPYDLRQKGIPKITISLTKPAEQAARDILRRLVPDSEVIHSTVRASKDRHTRHANTLAAQVALYAQLTGGKTRASSHRPDARADRVDLPYLGETYGHVDVNADGSVRLDARLDAETARAVLTLIRERQTVLAAEAAKLAAYKAEHAAALPGEAA